MERLKLSKQVRSTIPVGVSAESEQRREDRDRRNDSLKKRKSTLSTGLKTDRKFVDFCKACYILKDPVEAYRLVYDRDDPAEAVRLHSSVLCQNTMDALLEIKDDYSRTSPLVAGNGLFCEFVVQRVENYARLGFSMGEIGKLIGLNGGTLSSWLTRGREAEKQMDFDSPFFLFLKRYERAYELGIQEKLGQIVKAGTEKHVLRETKTVLNPDGTYTETITTKEQAPSWQALAWVLERVHSDRFSRNKGENVRDPKEEAEKLAHEINKLVAFEGDVIEQG
jgi:hypothetical protein